MYVHYEEGTDAEQHVTLKLTLPKRWNDESPVKLLQVRIRSIDWRFDNNSSATKGLLRSAQQILGYAYRINRVHSRAEPNADSGYWYSNTRLYTYSLVLVCLLLERSSLAMEVQETRRT